MNEKIAARICERLGVPDLVELLAERVSGADLNSLMLAVYDRRVAAISGPDLLALYRKNRLVKPADLSMIDVLEEQLATLRYWRELGFAPVELSPAAQWGSCSVVGTVSQHKVVSAVRQTEIMADATNAMALHIAELRKDGKLEGGGLLHRFCTVHRHIRAQEVKVKGFLPHFKVGCVVIAGRDVGDLQFERSAMTELIKAFAGLFLEVFGVDKIRWKLQQRDGHPGLAQRVCEHLVSAGRGIEVSVEEDAPLNNYYRGLQFKMLIEVGGKEWEIADGGFVDWTAQLMEDRKERLMIGGFGLDFLHRLLHGML